MTDKYVLIDKVSGKFMPNTSDLQEATLFDRDAFTLPNTCYKEIRVKAKEIKRLSLSIGGHFVQMNKTFGEFQSAGGTTTNLQNASVYDFSTCTPNALSLPVEIKQCVIIA